MPFFTVGWAALEDRRAPALLLRAECHPTDRKSFFFFKNSEKYLDNCQKIV
jgi:hypothetical protein